MTQPPALLKCSCGAQNAEGARLCASCGHTLLKGPASPAWLPGGRFRAAGGRTAVLLVALLAHWPITGGCIGRTTPQRSAPILQPVAPKKEPAQVGEQQAFPGRGPATRPDVGTTWSQGLVTLRDLGREGGLEAFSCEAQGSVTLLDVKVTFSRRQTSPEDPKDDVVDLPLVEGGRPVHFGVGIPAGLGFDVEAVRGTRLRGSKFSYYRPQALNAPDEVKMK